MLRTQRIAHTQLPDGACIRNQRPMSPDALEKCLYKLTPADWYAIVNSRVFFWLDASRLNRQKAACEPRPQIVITVDAHALIARYNAKAALTPINTGNARRNPARRCAETFVPYSEWVNTRWASEAEAMNNVERKRSHRPVELTVLDAVPDIMRFVVDITRLAPGQSLVAENR